MKYLKSENLEEHIAQFGKDVKIYPIDEILFNNFEETLLNWGSCAQNVEVLAKKDISFKWEEAKVNETKVFEVIICGKLIEFRLSLTKRSLLQRKAYGRSWLEQQLALSSGNNFPVLDLADSIINVICSSKSDDELQTEVLFRFSILQVIITTPIPYLVF